MPTVQRQMRALYPFMLVAVTCATGVCADSITVATYNLNWGNRRGDKMLDAIDAASADIICFQESTPVSERFLQARLAKTYPHFHSTGHKGRYLGERFTFASKHELSDLTFVPPSAGLFGFYTANLNLSGTDIHIINVHLTPVTIKRGRSLAEAMTVLLTTEEKHRKEIEVVVENIDHQRPTIVLGDFNSISTYVAPKRLVGLGMVDSYASLHEDADTQPTWRWPTRPLPLALRIDYIFHSKHFVTTKSDVVYRSGSDHSLVVATLEFGQK